MRWLDYSFVAEACYLSVQALGTCHDLRVSGRWPSVTGHRPRPHGKWGDAGVGPADAY